jgi:outer membrane protein assembly factor BamB
MRCLVLLLAAALLVASPSSTFAETPWTQFRGADGSGHSDAKGLPDKLDEKEAVQWKLDLPGKAWSSPVVWKKQVWVTNATEDGKKLSAVGVDLESGSIVHDVLVFDIEKPMFCHGLNSYGTPTPAIEEGRVYVSYGSAGTACVDTTTGAVLWKRQDLKCDHFRGPASSPVIYGDSVIIEFDGFDVQYVVALNKRTGETAWKKDRAFDYKTDNGDGKKGYGTPSIFKIDGRDVAICPAAVATETFDAKTGELLWTVRHDGMNASARPLYGHGLIYITNGTGRVVAVKPDGRGDITQNIAWESHKSVAKRSSPILVEDLLYMVTDDGIATCVDAKTGESVWTKRLGGEFAASPVYADGKLYFVNMEGATFVLKPGRKYDEVSTGHFDAGFMATPAITGKSILVRTKTALYRLEK